MSGGSDTASALPRTNREESSVRRVGPICRGAIVSWILQIVVAAILFQTLFFKFSAAEESVYIFTTLGMEPWGRIGSGVAELVACILLLLPRTVPLGALLALGVISGAIVSHLTRLGIVVREDGGLLFALAVVVFACSAAVLVLRRGQLRGWVRAVRPIRQIDGSIR